MFKKKIAWLLIIAMLLTQNGMTIFADNKGITNEETVESIEETAETSKGEHLLEPEEEETVESNEETTVEENLGEPEEEPEEEETVESNEETVEANLGESEEEPEEETELTKSKTEDDLYGWSNEQTAQVKYCARTGGTIEGPEDGMYPLISLYQPSKWYVDGVEGEVWFPGGADAIDNESYTDTYEFKTDTGDSNVSNAPYTVWGDYDKTYAFYSELLRKYYVFKGWTSDISYADPFNESYNKIEYYPGVQYTGIFKDNGTPKELYPVFIESNNLPGGGGAGSYENANVTIEFWQGYDDNQSEAELQQFVYGPTGYGISFMKVVNDQFPDGKDIKNNGPSDTPSNDDQLWSLNDQWQYEEASPEKQARVHFQTIYGQVSNGNFSATIPGKATNTYYGNRGKYNDKKLIGFATTRRATKAKYLLAETYDNILDDATYQSYEGYTLKLFPVFESSGGGGSENNHNFIFNMDDRFGEFKPGKNFVYNANTDDKDFIIPTEDDMKLQNKTNNWESDWMLWGWSKIQHGYHLGEKAFSLVTGNEEDVTLENVNLLNNSAYYSNSSNDDFAEKFKNPFETNKIISEFVAFKDDQVETTEDVNFYPLFVKRPKLRFEIRDGIEYNNKWKNASGENLATIKKDGNNVQYVEFNYGDPDTTFPELEYDTDRFITFDTNWSNYWFDNDYNRLVTDKQRRLPTIRRGNNLEKIIEMWKTQTYEDEKFPISDQYNNVAWLSISLDLAKVFTDDYGYDEASFTPTSEKLYTDKFFSYYPVIFDKKNIITLIIDKNAEGHKYATIEEGLPWREETTLLEVRRTEFLNNVYTDTYDSFYYYEEYGRQGGELYYVDDSTVSFEMDSFGRHGKQYKYKYYAFKESDPGTWYYNDHVYDDPNVIALDANGDTAYVGSGLIWDLLNEDKVRYSSDDNILENFEKGKINPNGILTMSMYWEPRDTQPKWRFIDATTNEELSRETHGSYSTYVKFAATASETKNKIMNYGAGYYKTTNAWTIDQSNGVTDVEVVDVKIEDAAIKDDRIVLVKPVIEVYIKRNSVDYPRIIFDVDKNGIASPSVSGPTSYISIKDKSEVIPPTVTSNDEEYVFETWVDSGNTPYTTEEIQNKFEEWKNNSPTDDLYFYPKFKKEKVLRFIIDSEYATVEPGAKTKFYSKDASTVVAPPFTEKAGYQFEKWVDKDGNSVTPSDWDGTYDIDIYAKFRTLKKFVFVVDDNYHDSSKVQSGDPTQREFDESSPLITPPKVYPKDGFDGTNKGGFAKKQNAAVDEIMSDTELNDFIDDWRTSTTKEDVTLYYIFVEDPSKNKIRFEVDSSKGEFIGSSVYFIDPVVFDAEKTNILVNPKSSYMFTGWVNADDQNEKYMKAEEITWDGTYTVTYEATFTTITPTPNPNPTPSPNPNNNPNNNPGSNNGGGGDSGGSSTPPSGYNPNTNNPQPNKQPEMSAEEKLANPPDSKFIIVNMNKYNPSHNDNSNGSSNDSGQNFLWETTDRVIWRLIQMDNIIENIDYRKTPEWDVVKSFFTQNCKFYDDGWCFLQYRGTNEWYHFAPNNIMDVGWFNKNGDWYYLQTDYNTTFGSMYTGVRDIDGIRYVFSKDGKLQGVLGFTALLDSQTTTK